MMVKINEIFRYKKFLFHTKSLCINMTLRLDAELTECSANNIRYTIDTKFYNI